MLLKFNSVIQNAGWISTSLNCIKKHRLKPDRDIKGKIKAKRKLRKKWQENRNPSTKTKLNKTTKELRVALTTKHAKETTFSAIIISV